MQNDNQRKFAEAVHNNDIKNVKKYLKIADPGANDNYAIRRSSEKGYTEIVRLLIQNPRVDLGARYESPIRLASKNGHTEVVRLLLKAVT